MFGPIVAQLQGDLPELGLGIVDPSLSLHAEWRLAVAESRKHPVPRALITGDGNRDLRPQPKDRGEPSSESVQETELRRVAQWPRTGKGANANVQSDDGADPGELPDRSARQDPALDPADLRIRHPDGTADRPQRQAGHQASGSQVASNG